MKKCTVSCISSNLNNYGAKRALLYIRKFMKKQNFGVILKCLPVWKNYSFITACKLASRYKQGCLAKGI